MRTLRLSTALLCASLLPVTANAASYIAIQVEAEDYQSKHSDWRVFSNSSNPNVSPDPDGSHSSSASGNAYVELLPDTRVTHSDQLSTGTNFWNTAGSGPSLSYNVNIPEAGRYLVFAKAYSTGTEDNGIHVGLNNSNPASGERMQWCNGKNQWTWSSAQRTNSNHCGTERTIYLDFSFAGANTVTFSAREDGFELDQFILLKETGEGLRCAPQSNDQISCNQSATDNSSSGGTSNDDPADEQPATEEPATEEPQDDDQPASPGGNFVACSSANSDPDGDGYGWENNASCLTDVTTATLSPSDSTVMCSSASADPDGDGYGWENNQTCLTGSAPLSPDSSETPCLLTDSDSDGDGWGWENNRSCRVR